VFFGSVIGSLSKTLNAARGRQQPGYPTPDVSDLVACPFCHELFAKGEAQVCPACGLSLVDMTKLPPSQDALAEDDFGIPTAPHLETLPMTYLGRGRGLLVLLSIVGIVAFFGPWVHKSSPSTEILTAANLAKKNGWIWGALVSWFVILPMVLSRRSIDQMRGARVAAAFFSAVPAMTAAILWFLPPRAGRVPLRFEWGWGLYLMGAVGLVATAVSVRFGGRVDDIRVSRGGLKGKGETLH
jgi:hypothetical protein